jgi:tol-pal system protein YbgF
MRTYVVLSLAGSVWVASCAIPQQLELIEREQRRLRAETTAVRSEASDIRADFERVRSSLADTRASLQEMQREVSDLRGRVEELRYALERQVGQSSREGEQKVKGLEARLARMEEELKQQSKLLRAQEEELKGLRRAGGAARDAPESKAPDATGGSAVAKATGEPESVRKEYEEALRLLDRKDYRLAISRLREFVKRYPNSEFADNAQYWIGECYYALKEYDQAILEFDAVRRKYPKGDKVPAALLKQGFAFAELGDRVDARLLLQELIERYPSSPEAAKAKEKLRSLQS